MIDIHAQTRLFLKELKDCFADRIWFVGLQGSYGRGEATESSDMDMVVILDELTPADVHRYHAMLDRLPHRDLMCGFLSGKKELLSWEPSDLFQLYFDTTPLVGSLDMLLPLLDGQAVYRVIKLGACNLYHGCVHNMLYGHKENALRHLYKSATFVVQAICYQQTGHYYRHQKDLHEMVQPREREILDIARELKNGGSVRFAEMSENLMMWCQFWIQQEAPERGSV